VIYLADEYAAINRRIEEIRDNRKIIAVGIECGSTGAAARLTGIPTGGCSSLTLAVCDLPPYTPAAKIKADEKSE
jgi:hypothetical protein